VAATLPLLVLQDGDPSRWLWLLVAALLIVFVASIMVLLLLRRRQQLVARLERIRREALILYDNAPCGYHAVDDQGLFANANTTFSRWLGYEKEELVGKVKFADVVDGGREALDHCLEELQAGRRSVDVVFIKKGGAKLPAMLGLLDMQSLSAGNRTVFTTIDNTRCHEALERIRTLDQELESFSYSISHDLRAPLRSIDGYSRILQEDYAAVLGDEGRRVLGVVMNNARRMGALIDDLLEYGRLGRKNLQRVPVNMSTMVNEIADELRLGYVDRKIDMRVGPLDSAEADGEMLRAVWKNLLDNAMKFTARQESAVIEVRSYKVGHDEICYEVKDNGVGFDMQYVDKLFGVFQRLHRIQDFGGTGVGLAIVKRIISRHGGRVWAEGSPQKGAVFYFTLPIKHGDA